MMQSLNRTLARLRSLLKSTIAPPMPYWRDALEDHQGLPAAEMGLQVGQLIFFIMVVGLIVLLPSAYLAGIVFVHPGGLPDVIGSQLAAVCRSTGNCDFGYLMAGYAFAIVFLMVALSMIFLSVSRYVATLQQPPDLRAEFAAIDDRIVALRDDLVREGVLHAEPGEKWDGD